MPNVKKIKVFSTAWCGYCKMEKAWLNENKVDYESVMVDENQEAAMYIAQKTQQLGVPVTEITFDDESTKYVVGFDRPTLSNLIGVK